VFEGERRRLDADSMIFFEDVGGEGHVNRIIDDQEIMLAFLVAPEHWSPAFPTSALARNPEFRVCQQDGHAAMKAMLISTQWMVRGKRQGDRKAGTSVGGKCAFSTAGFQDAG
jgi:hypothetical protein